MPPPRFVQIIVNHLVNAESELAPNAGSEAPPNVVDEGGANVDELVGVVAGAWPGMATSALSVTYQTPGSMGHAPMT